MPSPLDRTDKALLAALQNNARLTVAELAEKVSLTTSPCWRRVKILEEQGLITGYQAILSPKHLGYGVTALRRYGVCQCHDGFPFSGNCQKVRAMPTGYS